MRPLLTVALVGCVSAGNVECPNGDICPAGTVCREVTEGTVPPSTGLRCVNPADVEACAGLDERAECSLAAGGTGTCHDGACFANVCGNGLTDTGEVCDDRNTLAGDGCAAGCNSAEVCGNGVVDPVRLIGGQPAPNEQCDDGDRVPHDGCSAACSVETPGWRRADGKPPTAVTSSRLIFDHARRRFVGFGGQLHPSRDRTAETYTGRLEPCLAARPCVTWTELPQLLQPSVRSQHAMAYDPVRDRIVVLSGSLDDTDFPIRDHWEFDGATWVPITSTVQPAERTRAAMAFDPSVSRIVVYGGFATGVAGDTLYRDTWEWDGTTWVLISEISPEPLVDQTMAFDPVRGQLVLVGVTEKATMVTWRRDPTTGSWVEIPTVNPELRTNATLVWDTAQQRLMLVGEKGQSFDAHLWDGTTWSAPSPLPQGELLPGFAVAADPIAGHVIAYGLDVAGVNELAFVWDGVTWSRVTSTFPAGEVVEHAAAYDTLRDRTVLIEKNKTWELAGSTWIDAGDNDPRVSSGAMAFHSGLGETLLFGGNTLVSPAATNRTWLWNGSEWTEDLSMPRPSPRTRVGLAYEAVTDRIILFGGTQPNGQGSGETWAWRSGWTQITTPTAPSARFGAAMAYDWVNGTIVMFGGVASGALGDTWTFDPRTNTWTDRTSPGGPLPRQRAMMAWNNARRRVVMLGGARDDGEALADLWEWDGEGWTMLPSVVNPGRRVGHTLTSTATGVMLLGGIVGQPAVLDIWEHRWDGGLVDDLCHDANDFDQDGALGCADPDCHSVCQPACVSQPTIMPPASTPVLVCVADAPICGDATCDLRENCRICAADCECVPVCGDGYCDPGETLATCPGDCTP